MSAPSETDDVLVDRDGKTLVITVNRPKARTPWTPRWPAGAGGLLRLPHRIPYAVAHGAGSHRRSAARGRRAPVAGERRRPRGATAFAEKRAPVWTGR